MIIAAIWPTLVKGQFYYGTNPLEINDFNERHTHNLKIPTALGDMEIVRGDVHDGFAITAVRDGSLGFRLETDPNDSSYQVSLRLPEGLAAVPFFDVSGVFSVCTPEGTGRLEISGTTAGGAVIYPTLLYSDPVRGIAIDTGGVYKLSDRVAKPIGVFFGEAVTTLSISVHVQGCGLISFALHELYTYDEGAHVANPDIALTCGSAIWLGLDGSASISEEELQDIASFAEQLLSLGLGASIQDLRASVFSYANVSSLLGPGEILTTQSLADSGAIAMQLDVYRSAARKAEGDQAHTGFYSFLEQIAPSVSAGDLVCVVTDGIDNSGISERERTHHLAANLHHLIGITREIKATGAHLLWVLGEEPGRSEMDFYFRRLTDAASTAIVRPGSTSGITGSHLDIVVPGNFSVVPDILQEIWANDCSELILSLRLDSLPGVREAQDLHVALTWNNPHADRDSATLFYIHRRAGERAPWMITDSVYCRDARCSHTDRYRRDGMTDDEGIYYISTASPSGQALKSNRQLLYVPADRYLHISPNPVTELLYVRTHPCEQCSVTLYDTRGRALYSIPADRPDLRLDVSALAPGTYSIKLDDRGNHYTQALFFVKTN